jgi:uncharacterized membrane protein
LGRIARIFFAGLLVLLPILVTLIVTVWFAQLLQSYAGPDSLIGRLIVLLGLNLVSSATGAYFLGFLIILGGIFLLGLVVENAAKAVGAELPRRADDAHPAHLQCLRSVEALRFPRRPGR